MSKVIVSEGRTTSEAVENGLKQLHVRKDQVEIKVLDQEDKKSFFSILSPRVVKVELTVKEGIVPKESKVEKRGNQEPKREHRERRDYSYHREERKKINLTPEEAKQIESTISEFLEKFTKALPTQGVTYEVSNNGEKIHVKLMGENISYLIGYRGDALNSLQIILSSIANKDREERIGVLVDIGDYRAKRAKTLEELAEKIAKTVVRTGKKITLEPMTAYERKIIHTKLQENNQIRTYSVGEEPNRKIVVTVNK